MSLASFRYQSQDYMSMKYEGVVWTCHVAFSLEGFAKLTRP